MNIYKVGVVGCGRMGWIFNEDKLINQPVSHITAYFADKRTKVTAICDVNVKKLFMVSRKYSVRGVYTDYDKMLLSEKLDIVSICTPTETHRDICIAAAKAGARAIFCEKPIATSIKEADEMIGACKEYGVKLIINHTRRWDTSFSVVNDMLKKKIVGNIGLITAFSTVGLVNGGTHLFDLLRQYLGDIESISGAIIPDKSTDPGGRGVIRFKKGYRCFFDSSYRDYLLFGANIYGDKGVIEIRGQIRGSNVCRLFKTQKSKSESGIKELKEVNYKAPKWKSPIVRAVKNIINSLENRESIMCSGEDGKAALEAALAFHESSQNKGREISMPLKNKKLKIIPRMTSFTKDGRLR